MTADRGERTTTARAAYRRTLRVVYPPGEGRIALRTEEDWNRDIEPDAPPDGGPDADPRG